MTDLYTLWPKPDAPGRYEVRCSCERWDFTGTAAEIKRASAAHDDSPWRSHVVVIMHGGRRVDIDDDPGPPRPPPAPARKPAYMDNPKACGARENTRWGYLPCGCENDGFGNHAGHGR